MAIWQASWASRPTGTVILGIEEINSGSASMCPGLPSEIIKKRKREREVKKAGKYKKIAKKNRKQVSRKGNTYIYYLRIIYGVFALSSFRSFAFFGRGSDSGYHL